MKDNKKNKSSQTPKYEWEIFIIENDEGKNNSIRKNLVKHNYQCKQLYNGNQLSAAIKPGDNQIMILDYKLPDNNAEEVITALHEKNGSVPPFIILTGLGDEKMALKMMKLGARDFIVRTTNFIEVLLEKLRRIVEELERNKENERYKKLLSETEHLVGAGAWLYYAKTGKWVMSDNWMALHGCTEKMLNSNDLLKVVHPEDVEKMIEAFKKAEKDGEPFQTNHRIIRQDNGEIRYMQTLGKAEFDSENNFEFFSGAALDITERVHAEKREVKTTQNLQSLLKLTKLDDLELKKLSDYVLKFRKQLELRNSIAEAFVLNEKGIIFKNVLHILLKHFKSRFGFFGYINQNGDLVSPSMTYDIWDQCKIENKSIVFPKEKWGGLWGESLKTRKSLIKNGQLKVPDGHVSLKNSMVGVIKFQGNLIGQLAFANKKDGYSQNDLNALKEICRYISPLLNASINEEKFKEELLKEKTKTEENEEIYRKTFEEVAVGIVHVNEKGHFTRVNKKFCSITGYSYGELMNMDIAKITHPDDLKREQHYFKQVLNSQTDSYTIEKRYFHKDNKIIWVVVYSNVVRDKNNKIRFAVASVLDVTQQKMLNDQILDAKEKAEESDFRLQLAADSGGLGIWDWDVQKNEMIWDERMFQLYGIDKNEFSTQVDTWEKRLHPEDKEKALKELDLALGGKKQFDTVFRIVQPDGAILHLKADAIVLRDKKNRPLRMIGVNKDITEPVLREKELVDARDKAEESGRLKSAFLANMSHEIRTPMNGIMGFTDLLKQPGLSGKQQKQFIDLIHKSGKRLIDTVTDLVDISKIEAGLVAVSESELNINKELESFFSFFLPEARQKGLDLTLEQKLPENNKIIVTDKVKIHSIMTNLIKNAIKYTPEGWVKFGCRINENMWIFYTQDSGIGIPENRHKAIFDRFVQADIADTRAFEGSGLGLSIVRAYVEMLDGDISLESEEDKGSTFSVSFPLCQMKKYLKMEYK